MTCVHVAHEVSDSTGCKLLKLYTKIYLHIIHRHNITFGGYFKEIDGKECQGWKTMELWPP